jgi:hypothetical protein
MSFNKGKKIFGKPLPNEYDKLPPFFFDSLEFIEKNGITF